MEGVADELMRELLTSLNHYDFCVTEFIRVVDCLVPKHIFRKICPELDRHCLTKSGTPLRMQLLGQEPDWMAENAIRALEMGSHGVDVNFGCPAKAVNKSKGGAVLLNEPEKIYQIMAKIRAAIGMDATLSAKIRLGFNDASKLDEIVSAIESANVNPVNYSRPYQTRWLPTTRLLALYFLRSNKSTILNCLLTVKYGARTTHKPV